MDSIAGRTRKAEDMKNEDSQGQTTMAKTGSEGNHDALSIMGMARAKKTGPSATARGSAEFELGHPDMAMTMEKIRDFNKQHKERFRIQMNVWMKEQDEYLEGLLSGKGGNGPGGVTSLDSNGEGTGEVTGEGTAEGSSRRTEQDVVDTPGSSTIGSTSFIGKGERQAQRQQSMSDPDVAGLGSALDRHREMEAKVKDQLNKATNLSEVKGVMNILRHMLASNGFEMFMGMVIVMHICFMAWQADFDMESVVMRSSDTSAAVVIIEIIFNIIYTLETSVKLLVLRKSFFIGTQRSWNIFDAFLVLVSWYDIQASLQGEKAEGNVAQLRILRLMKMLKVFRMFQLMRSLKELRLIVSSMMSSMKTMVWAVCLILAVCFMFGICFVQACTNFLEDPVNDIHKEDLLVWWGSVGTSINALFIASMGGTDWADIADTLKPVGMAYYYLFLCYIGFFLTVVTNTLTSLFVESAMAAADKDQAAVVQAELDQKDKYIAKLQGWYDTLDTDGDGFVSLEEFMAQADRAEMVEFCVEMEISIMDVQQFFMVLSSNGRRSVDLETFIIGCIKLRGTAKSIDLMDLYWEHKETAEVIHELVATCNTEFARMRANSAYAMPAYLPAISHTTVTM